MSPSERQSQELFRKLSGCHAAFAGAGPGAEAENRLSLELRNGSRVVALPGAGRTIRGYSAPRLIVLDEAARVPDELIAALRPMLAVGGGRLVAMSTPAGRRGWFYREWAVGELLFEAESLCRFVSGEGQLFRDELLEEAFTDDVEPLFAAA